MQNAAHSLSEMDTIAQLLADNKVKVFQNQKYVYNRRNPIM